MYLLQLQGYGMIDIIMNSFNLYISDNQNPMAYALSELLKGQLDLTANFLSTQKTLYANYCASLSTIIQRPDEPSCEKVSIQIPSKKIIQ